MPKGGGGGGRGGRGRGMMGGGGAFNSSDLAAGDAVIAQMTEAQARLAAASGNLALLNQRLTDVGMSPEFIQILNDRGITADAARLIPPGSKPFPGSYEAVAYRVPSGEVVRIQNTPMERVNHPLMTQPFETVTRNGTTIERLPYIPNGSDVPRSVIHAASSALEGARTPGFRIQDLHSGNFGISSGNVGAKFTHGGQTYYAQIFDPGSMVRGNTTKIIQSGHVGQAIIRKY